MPGFVSPYASAVTGNRLRPFPSAPLRTGLTTFPSIRLSSEPILSIFVRSLVGFPAWIAWWQDSQTTKVLRFRAAILWIQIGFPLRPLTSRSASFLTWWI